MMSELYRKSLHLLILLIPVTYHFLGKWQSVKIFAIATFFVVSIDILRQHSTKFGDIFVKLFGTILRSKEIKGEFCGISYVGVAACLCFSLFKAEFAVTAFVILTVSDMLAAIFGKSLQSKEFFEKSTAGSIAFFVSALLVLMACGNFYHMDWWFYILGVFGVFVVTMFEARPSFIQIDDNFAIPVGFCVVMTFFDVVLNYQF
jgi:dolichol kinase